MPVVLNKQTSFRSTVVIVDSGVLYESRDLSQHEIGQIRSGNGIRKTEVRSLLVSVRFRCAQVIDIAAEMKLVRSFLPGGDFADPPIVPVELTGMVGIDREESADAHSFHRRLASGHGNI